VGSAELTLVKQQPISLGQKRSTAYIKISTGQSGGGLSNTGYWGIPVQQDQEYQLSVIIQSESAESAANEVLNFVSNMASGLQSVYDRAVTSRVTDIKLSKHASGHLPQQQCLCNRFATGIFLEDVFSVGQQLACRSMDCLPTTNESFLPYSHTLIQAACILHMRGVCSSCTHGNACFAGATSDCNTRVARWEHSLCLS